MKRLVSLLVAAAMLLVAFSAVAEEISGPLVLYSSMTDNDIDNLIEAFNEVYPNVEVEVVNGSAGELAARIRAEKDNPQGDQQWGGLSPADGDANDDIFAESPEYHLLLHQCGAGKGAGAEYPELRGSVEPGAEGPHCAFRPQLLLSGVE